MNPIIKQTGIKFGLILAGVNIFFYIFAYAVNVELLTKWWLGLSMMGVSLVIYVLAILSARKQLGEVIDFKGAFTTFFITAALGSAIILVFNLLLFNVIDTELAATVKELTIKAAVENMQRFNAPAATINETITQMEQQDTYGVKTQVTGYFFGLAITCILGVILALILKRQPVYKD